MYTIYTFQLLLIHIIILKHLIYRSTNDKIIQRRKANILWICHIVFFSWLYIHSQKTRLQCSYLINEIFLYAKYMPRVKNELLSSQYPFITNWWITLFFEQHQKLKCISHIPLLTADCEKQRGQMLSNQKYQKNVAYFRGNVIAEWWAVGINTTIKFGIENSHNVNVLVYISITNTNLISTFHTW